LALLFCTLIGASLAAAFTLNAGNPSQLVTAPGAASASFNLAGGNLTVVLTNISTADVLIPSQVLTALFFGVDGNILLTPVSATLSGGSTVFFDSAPAGGIVGGEWAYKNSLVGAPGGLNEGISSAGFALFGGANFPGPGLDPPAAVNGLNYGITSAGDNSGTGNAAVTGNDPLIQNQVTFVLSGAGDSLTINGAAFQYGTALSEPNICVDCPQTTVPEPSFLLSIPLIGVAMLWNRRRQQRRAEV